MALFKKFLTQVQIEEAVIATMGAAEELGLAPPVLAGGAAMAFYGSPRLTVDVDVVGLEIPKVEPNWGKLSFGGVKFLTVSGVPVDWIVRNDEHAALYADAVSKARQQPGYSVVTPEHLAIMKLAAGRPKDEQDLVWLLQQQQVRGRSLVDRGEARGLASRFLGGKFATDSFNSFAAEADWKTERERESSE